MFYSQCDVIGLKESKRNQIVKNSPKFHMVIVGTESADTWRTAAGYLPFSALKQKLENAPPY